MIWMSHSLSYEIRDNSYTKHIWYIYKLIALPNNLICSQSIYVLENPINVVLDEDAMMKLRLNINVILMMMGYMCDVS